MADGAARGGGPSGIAAAVRGPLQTMSTDVRAGFGAILALDRGIQGEQGWWWDGAGW